MKGPQQNAPTVLVVEDEPELVAIYEAYLQDECEVKTATSGTEALEIVDETVDVVLLDRGMPDMSGDEVLEKLRARGSVVPVAMVTGAEPDTDIVELPFDEYLIKPIDRESLVNAVQLLANRASFEAKSREFFRLASKKTSLEAEGIVDESAYRDLTERMANVQAELDDTISTMLRNNPEIATQSSLSEDEIETLLIEVSDHTLPADIRDLIEEYQSLQNARPPFMWKWVHRLAPQNTLPCVDTQFRESVPVDKTITILFITLLDDILEKSGDRETFNEISKIPFDAQTADPHAPSVDTEYVMFSRKVWQTLRERIESAPNYDMYRELFEFDMKQAINSIEYADLAIRRPELATMDDLERYESHNMAMFAYADIDLMHSSVDMQADLSTLRKAIWTAQLMSRIGNWVSTWEREIREGDYCSGPVLYALESGIISRSELRSPNVDSDSIDSMVDRIKQHGVEKRFLTRWEQHHRELKAYNEELTVDLGAFIDGTEEVLRYHLASTGLK